MEMDIENLPKNCLQIIDDDETILFTVYLKKPSLETIDTVLALRNKLMQDSKKLDNKHPELVEYINNLPEINGIKQITEDKFIVENDKFQGEIKQLENDFIINLFKKIYSTKGLDPTQVSMLDLPITDKFWRRQNIVEIKELTNSFRADCGV